MAYEHKEGRGSCLLSDYKTTDSHPDFTGDAKWRGEIIKLSIWKGMTQTGKEKLSIQLQEPRQKSDAPQRYISPAPADLHEDDIPF
jgi:hypothetical protein